MPAVWSPGSPGTRFWASFYGPASGILGRPRSSYGPFDPSRRRSRSGQGRFRPLSRRVPRRIGTPEGISSRNVQGSGVAEDPADRRGHAQARYAQWSSQSLGPGHAHPPVHPPDMPAFVAEIGLIHALAGYLAALPPRWVWMLPLSVGHAISCRQSQRTNLAADQYAPPPRMRQPPLAIFLAFSHTDPDRLDPIMAC